MDVHSNLRISIASAHVVMEAQLPVWLTQSHDLLKESLRCKPITFLWPSMNFHCELFLALADIRICLPAPCYRGKTSVRFVSFIDPISRRQICNTSVCPGSTRQKGPPTNTTRPILTRNGTCGIFCYIDLWGGAVMEGR